ncbi:HNH endonuclease [Candidatus Nitrotoga sp. BS]
MCGGYLHMNSNTTDHIERNRDGGSGNVENGQLTHSYCNSTYKQ